MERKTEKKIVLVVRRTRLDELVARFNTREQARFYIEHMGADFSDYLREHERYRQAVSACEGSLRLWGRLQILDRSFLPTYVFGPEDTVVVLGQDGLVVNTAKYLDGHVIIGVNPDPGRWDGVLLPFAVPDLDKVVAEVLVGRRGMREATMAEVRLNTGQRLYAVNDLFVGPRSHTSARYVIRIEGAEEQQSSSGIIVSTGLGSTGWLRSVVSGAAGVFAAISGSAVSLPVEPLTWEARRLFYSVREPFPSKTTKAGLVFGVIEQGQRLELTSQTPEHGVIFSDGIESDFLPFNSGTVATIAVADKRVRMAV